MTFKQILFASCALVISATTATAQIPSYVPTDGLVGWWPFNGNANDESGNGNNGAVNGATLTTNRFGAVNNAYSFNGTNCITIPNNSVFNTSSGTWCIWVFIPSSSGGNGYTIMDKGSNLTDDLGIQEYQSRPRAGINWGSGGATLGGGNYIIADGNWHFFVMTWNSTSFSIDLDAGGTQQTAGVNGSLFDLANGLPIRIGCSDSPYWQSYVGSLDDIAIYNRVLTEQEIQNLYNGNSETVATGDGSAPLPQGIPYQAAARDAQGQVIADAPVNVRFTLHEGAADGAASYAETHALTTNSLGLFNTVFGNGTPEQSAFDSINWAATTKFLQVEIDLGEGYVDMGTTQLLSVPYALRSDEAARVKNAGLPIFNDNAAALAGGLVAGEMYRTSAGVLMIVY